MYVSKCLISGCAGNTYGVNCANTCDCETSTTLAVSQICDTRTGACFCQTGWTGTRCDVDIDECNTGTDICQDPLKGCHNTQGGFTCSCYVGYREDNGTCVQSKNSNVYVNIN